MRNLVITSDDFGMSHGINQGIYQAAKENLITCTNYMVPTPWFEHAISVASTMNLDFGIHLTLTNEWDFYKWRPITSAKSLRDKQGYLKKNIYELMQDGVDTNEIKEECYAQIDIATKKDPRIMFIDLHMCIPTIEEDVVVNPLHELTLLEIINDISRETGLMYPYSINKNRLSHFDSHISISGKTTEEVVNYLNNIGSGNHHLSCHCSIESEEPKHFTLQSNPWALEYRLIDTQTLRANWFNDAIINNDIKIMPLSTLVL